MTRQDEKRLNDNEVDDRIKAALEALGTARGITTAGDAALRAARRALHLLSCALISVSVKRDL
jgi:hypothetical protein